MTKLTTIAAQSKHPPSTTPRRQHGTTLAEMPLALWIIAIMCFTLLILAVETMRFGFFWNACREAAAQAAKCQTFQNDSSIGPSAVTTATTWASKATSAFTGLTLNAVHVYILQSDVNATTTVQNPDSIALATAADTTQYIYEIQVELDGQIEPIVPLGAGVFGSIPGLTGPFPVVVRSQYAAEDPQGLNQ